MVARTMRNGLAQLPTNMSNYNAESPFNELQELELAAELLEVQNEEELDQFLGGLLKKAVPQVGKFLKSPAGKAVGGFLKGAVKKALPIAGKVLGNMVVPGLGGMIGGQLAGGIGSALGLELEGLSNEDREFEVAKQLVRLGGSAATLAAATPGNASAAKQAVISAAKAHAPGLVKSGGGCACGNSGGQCDCGSHIAQSGRWERRGGQVVLLGL